MYIVAVGMLEGGCVGGRSSPRGALLGLKVVSEDMFRVLSTVKIGLLELLVRSCLPREFRTGRFCSLLVGRRPLRCERVHGECTRGPRRRVSKVMGTRVDRCLLGQDDRLGVSGVRGYCRGCADRGGGSSRISC